MKTLLTLFVLLFSSSVVAEQYNCKYTFDNKVENFIIERQDNYFLRIDYEETYKIGDVVYEDENLINLYSSPDNYTDDTAYLFVIDKKQKGFTMIGLQYKNSTDIIEGVCNSVLADDISDFEIEGISVGDSLLDYMSLDGIKSEIEKHKSRYAGDEFAEVYLYKKFQNYDNLSFFVKPNDQKYIIHGVYGSINYHKKIDQCYIKMNEIDDELSVIFKNKTKTKGEIQHSKYPTGDNNVRYINYDLENGSIGIDCYNFEENLHYYETEILSVSSIREELYEWLSRP